MPTQNTRFQSEDIAEEMTRAAMQLAASGCPVQDRPRLMEGLQKRARMMPALERHAASLIDMLVRTPHALTLPERGVVMRQELGEVLEKFTGMLFRHAPQDMLCRLSNVTGWIRDGLESPETGEESSLLFRDILSLGEAGASERLVCSPKNKYAKIPEAVCEAIVALTKEMVLTVEDMERAIRTLTVMGRHEAHFSTSFYALTRLCQNIMPCGFVDAEETEPEYTLGKAFIRVENQLALALHNFVEQASQPEDLEKLVKRPASAGQDKLNLVVAFSEVTQIGASCCDQKTLNIATAARQYLIILNNACKGVGAFMRHEAVKESRESLILARE